MTSAASVEALDWQGFSARYFPERRRHDLEVLAAYEAYRNASHPAIADDGALAGAAADTWEGEGGSARW